MFSASLTAKIWNLVRLIKTLVRVVSTDLAEIAAAAERF